MTIVQPVPVEGLPEAPSTVDWINFDERADAWNAAVRDMVTPGMNKLAADTFENAKESARQAEAALSSADLASDKAGQADVSLGKTITAQDRAEAAAAATGGAFPPQSSNRQVLRSMNGMVEWSGDIWGVPIPIAGVATANLQAWNRYHVDTSQGPVTLYLPDAEPGDPVYIVDVGRMSNINRITVISANGVIGGEAGPLIINRAGIAVVMMCDAQKGWVNG